MRISAIFVFVGLSCLVPLSAGENDLRLLLPGKWRGIYEGCRLNLTIQKSGAGYTGKAIVWRGISEAESDLAARGQVIKPQWEHTGCYGYQVNVQLDGDTVDFQFFNPQQLVKGAKFANYRLKGKLKDPGVVVQLPLKEPRKDGALDQFRLCKAELLAKPAPLDQKTGAVLKMACLDNDDYHYTCYIPTTYDPAKPTPVLIHFNPGGDAQPLSTKAVEELGWISVGLTESRNGPYSVIFENRDAVMFDLQRRFNIDMTRWYFGGISGGARASSYTANVYPDLCAGLILACAAYEDAAPPTNIPAFFLTGTGDMNNKEVTRAFETSKTAGRKCAMGPDTGGHKWNDQQKDAAVRWLGANAVPAAKKK